MGRSLTFLFGVLTGIGGESREEVGVAKFLEQGLNCCRRDVRGVVAGDEDTDAARTNHRGVEGDGAVAGDADGVGGAGAIAESAGEGDLHFCGVGNLGKWHARLHPAFVCSEDGDVVFEADTGGHAVVVPGFEGAGHFYGAGFFEVRHVGGKRLGRLDDALRGDDDLERQTLVLHSV